MCNSGDAIGHLESASRFVHRFTHLNHFLFLSSGSLVAFFGPHSLDQLCEGLLPSLLLLIELLLCDDSIEVVDRIIRHHILLGWSLYVINLHIECVHIGYSQASSHKVLLHLSRTCRSLISSASRRWCRGTGAVFGADEIHRGVKSASLAQGSGISTIRVLDCRTKNVLEVWKRHLRGNHYRLSLIH